MQRNLKIDETARTMEYKKMEKKLIQETLKKHNGKRSIAAKDLRISERTLYRKIKTYGLE